MENASLPTGFRFYPYDEDILLFLHEKTCNPELDMIATYAMPIGNYDIYSSLPDDLPPPPNVGSEMDEKYYFVSRPKRPSRDVNNQGWWKSSTKKNLKNGLMRNQLNFFMYVDGVKSTRNTSHGTNWIMHEYTIPFIHGSENFALCKIYQKEDKEDDGRKNNRKKDGEDAGQDSDDDDYDDDD